MGGNMITKYLGEPRNKPENIVGGISVCQGYDANRATQLLLEWKGFRRLYTYAITENMKSFIRRWHKILFPQEIKKKFGITEREILNAATLAELDDVYTRKLAGFKSLPEFYHAMSCRPHLQNIKVPMVFINAVDDPIVPPPLLEVVRDAALRHDKMIYVEQKFGGHLGFYEGGLFYSNPLTWMDRMIVHISHALVSECSEKKGELEELCDGEREGGLRGCYGDTSSGTEAEPEFMIWEKGGHRLRMADRFNINPSDEDLDVFSPSNFQPSCSSSGPE